METTLQWKHWFGKDMHKGSDSGCLHGKEIATQIQTHTHKNSTSSKRPPHATSTNIQKNACFAYFACFACFPCFPMIALLALIEQHIKNRIDL